VGPLVYKIRKSSVRCRQHAYERRRKPLPVTGWLGAEKQRRARRIELADQLLGLAETADGGDPKTGRRFFYLALSHGIIAPSMEATVEARKERDAAYALVTDVLGDLRKAGRLGWDAVLDLTRDVAKWQTYGSPREARAAMRRRYDEDRWIGQDFFPTLIVEKDTLEPVCQSIAYRWQIPFASSRGYGSLKLQFDVSNLLNQRRATHRQEALVLFISDHDPSGFDLQRAWEQALTDFGVMFLMVRCGLNLEQIPDADRARLSIGVKPSDSRAEKYIEQHGDRCWEADILDAHVIERTIASEIELHLNVELWDRRIAEIERARKLL
jgi:hypothetical protein